MIFWLDHLIFGNGSGLSSPFLDNRFYWLKDAYTKKSELYTFSVGFGAQLYSFQWVHPKAQEKRMICGYEFSVFRSSRVFGRVAVAWCIQDFYKIGDPQKLLATIRSIEPKLGK